MAVIKKLVNRGIPAVERTQTFSSSEVNTGDVLDFFNSLGGAAEIVRIILSANCDLKVRRNVLQKMYPVRDDVFSNPLVGSNINTAQPIEYIDETVSEEPVGDATSMTVKEVVLYGPIRNMEVKWTTGTWTVVAS